MHGLSSENSGDAENCPWVCVCVRDTNYPQKILAMPRIPSGGYVSKTRVILRQFWRCRELLWVYICVQDTDDPQIILAKQRISSGVGMCTRHG